MSILTAGEPLLAISSTLNNYHTEPIGLAPWISKKFVILRLRDCASSTSFKYEQYHMPYKFKSWSIFFSLIDFKLTAEANLRKYHKKQGKWILDFRILWHKQKQNKKHWCSWLTQSKPGPRIWHFSLKSKKTYWRAFKKAALQLNKWTLERNYWHIY